MKRQSPWLKPFHFKPGNNANPKGRPKEKTMKEFAREYLANLSKEDRAKFLNSLNKDLIWRMAEGNPHNTEDITSKGEAIQIAGMKIIKE